MNTSKAGATTAYIEGLQLPAGGSFEVLPWEKRLLRGLEKTTGDAALTVGRGNGKSALVAGLAAAVVDPNGPLHALAAEVIVVASTFRQGLTIFRDCLCYLGGKYDLSKRDSWRVNDSVNSAIIEHRPTGSRAICVGSDPAGALGLRPKLALCDEPAAWSGDGAGMLASVRTGLGKVAGGRLIALGTRSADDSHWFSAMLNGGGGRYIQAHQAAASDPPCRASTWEKANPSMRFMPALKERIALEASEAKADPSLMASFKSLRLNLGTADTLQATLLDSGLWKDIEGDAARAGKCYWGVDLGGSAASSAIAGFWPETGRLQVVAAFPSEPSLAIRGASDGVSNLYVLAASRGELWQFGGMSVDYKALVTKALEVLGQPAAVACDRWRLADLVDALKGAGVKNCGVEARGQGYKDGGEDVRAFRHACGDKAVTPLTSLFLTSAMSCARTLTDAAGNVKLSKGVEGGRRLRARDDAAAASILAVALGSRRTKGNKKAGVYLGRAA